MYRWILVGTGLFLLPGVIVLMIILIVKKKRRQPEELPRTAGNEVPEMTGVQPGKARPADGGTLRLRNGSLSDTENGYRQERTRMLTYTTLILKDCERPVRVYKADLFQPVCVGREQKNRVRLEDPSVSRRHLKVYRKDGLVFAENLSRANGTKLNGRYLTGPKEIVSGDLLELGRVKLLVEID